MDVIFLHSKELNWKENFENAKNILNKEVLLLDGLGTSSIKDAYQHVINNVSSEFFMMIEADNFVFERVNDFLDSKVPTKFWTTNKYDVEYEHGGIKILNTEATVRQLKANVGSIDNFEVSANLILTSNTTILSEHRFDWSPQNEWVTIAKELIKLHLWGQTDFINRWIKHPIPAKIYEEVLIILKDASFTQVFETLFPSLGEIYDSKFKK
jgi:hypothetical protein